MSKPREWLITDPTESDLAEGIMMPMAWEKNAFPESIWKKRLTQNFGAHAIEYSAYQKVVERLKEALENEYEFLFPENLNLADTDMRTYVAQELAKLGIEDT